MKNLTKSFLFLLFILISLPAFSQFKAGVKAGLNISSIHQNFSSDYSDFELNNQLPRLLYSVGPCFDIGFGDWVSLQPALLLSAKGVGVNVDKESDGNASGYDRFTITYLEVPINVAVKFKGIQAYLGPYFAIALAGTNKWKYEAGGESTSGSEALKFKNEVDVSDLNPDMAGGDFFSWYHKPIDFGLNIGAGYKLGPILFSAQYSIGLANLTPDLKGEEEYLGFAFDPKDAKTSTRTFTFSVSYFFGKWKE
jgi:hypothetical protein